MCDASGYQVIVIHSSVLKGHQRWLANDKSMSCHRLNQQYELMWRFTFPMGPITVFTMLDSSYQYVFPYM